MRSPTGDGMEINVKSGAVIVYKEQNMSCWRVFKLKCKKIWCILRGKDYTYSEILVSKEEFKDLQEYIQSVE